MKENSSMQGAEIAMNAALPANRARNLFSGLVAGEGAWQRLSLREKAIFTILALLAYVALLTGYVLYEKNGLHGEFIILQNLHEIDQSLRALRISSYHTLVAAHDAEELGEKLGQSDGHLQIVRLDFALIDSNFNSLTDRLAPDTPHFSQITAAVNQARAAFAKNDLLGLIGRLKDLISEAETLSLEQRQRLEKITADFQKRSERLTSVMILHTIIGLGLFAAASWVFFSQLTRDFGRVRQRAIEVAKGIRGDPLETNRQDEVGDLMVAVNQMAVDLDRRERELALEREKTFHQEKMAAIGTLAAGIAHEIGNPITAISGIAQEMCDVHGGPRCMAPGAHCRPELILEQTERIAKITREITEFAAPRSAHREWLDLNELIRSTVSLLRYDRRFRNLEVELDLDGQLPAIMGVGDQLTQVMMNLLINAADAVNEVSGRTSGILVSTRPQGNNVLLTIHDTGSGMDPLTLSRATEAFYTTKAPGKGTGLGLTVCASIISGHGGVMNIASSEGEGTTITIALPVHDPKEKHS